MNINTSTSDIRGRDNPTQHPSADLLTTAVIQYKLRLTEGERFLRVHIYSPDVPGYKNGNSDTLQPCKKRAGMGHDDDVMNHDNPDCVD